MSFVLVSEGLAIGTDDMRGQYLREFDPDAHDGRGEAVWTDDISLAKKFDSVGSAMAAWKQQSAVRPVRPDGKPNRPLTAFTVSVAAMDTFCSRDTDR